jgi:DNA polymerase I-like protein with 3'-5' exonuclease and polymerase domains
MWRDGIKTRYNILETARRKIDLQYYLTELAMPDLRIKRLNKHEYALVQDEVVLLKRYMFDLYPELEQFLKETHKRFLTGESKWVKNEFDEWVEEPIYRYETYGFVRAWCFYTAMCNGFLMQSPSAIGAQKAMIRLIRHFWNCPDFVPQAFIHDEVVAEVNPTRIDLIEEAAYIMIEEMQSVLSSVRIATEASMSDYWQKADGFWTQSYWRDAKC